MPESDRARFGAAPVAAPAAIPAGGDRGIPARTLIAILLGLVGIDHVLLLGFLGMSAIAQSALALPLVLLCIYAARGASARVPVPRVLACLAVALVVLVLGGEGRLLYANVDWQGRDALLSDIVRAPWPFAYAGGAEPRMLRAPIGMYLLPAVAGKLAGRGGADAALLVQNMLVLGALLSLGSLLFDTARGRRIALVTVCGFSGADIVTAAIRRPDVLLPFDVHIEGLAHLQYSSMATLVFWVPQHAVSGWTGGLLFLLWRRGVVPLPLFLAAVPLLALWSPLGVMGTVPFAALAAGTALLRRQIRVADALPPAVAVLAALPSLAYLAADAGQVGTRLAWPGGRSYLLSMAIEVVPWVLCLLDRDLLRRHGVGTVAVTLACLFLFPFVMIGGNVDFMMRASIAPLLVLALMVADTWDRAWGTARALAIAVVFAVGLVTPAREVTRAIKYRAAPLPRCDLAAAWRQSFPALGDGIYFARVTSLPAMLRPARFTAVPPTTRPCWPRPWKVRRVDPALPPPAPRGVVA